MLKIIAVYILAIVLMPLIAIVKNVVLLILPMVFFRKTITIITHTIINICLTMLVVYIVAWVCHKLEVKPSFIMFTIPIFLVVLRSLNQVTKIRSGYSMAEAMTKGLLALKGQQCDPNYRTLLIRREYANLISSISGFFIGGIFFLR